ncbi:MAG: class II aldolase/adducin family protein [Desulfovibrio sp.]|jgi:ribulose-5-phosphate 4-epimerase/fuculose-1-phosphate aldolase|nr:class II aldolase/adducin family protein [Desulfovibrio sp.]
MNTSGLMRELLELCRRVYDKGFVSGSGGNISAKDGGDMLITPTGRNLGALAEGDIVRVRLTRNGPGKNRESVVVGSGIPSQEWRMHCRCHERPDVACVLHVHSSYASAVSCLEIDSACGMPVYTPGYSVRVGRLPVVPYFRPGSAELASAVGDHIVGTAAAPGRNSVLLANHGILSVGASMEQAMNIAEEIEENARLFLLLGGRGRPLSETQQAELAGTY